MSDKKEPFYLGRVIRHPAYVETEKSNPALAEYTEGFTQYWRFGYSPIIGKDGILEVPDIYADNAIGRAHVEPDVKDPQSFSSSDEAWAMWAMPAISAEPVVPTSNSFLIYCVAEDRTCCLLAYLDQGEQDSHAMLNDLSFRREMRNMAERFYKTYRLHAMPVEEHSEIFADKWVNPNFKE